MPAPEPATGSAPAWLSLATRRLGVLAAACMGLLLVLYWLAVRTEWGQRAGNAALAGRFRQPPALVDGSLDLLETISILSLFLVGGTLCGLGLVRGGWPLGIGVGLVILGANVTTQVLKRVIFTRPDLLAETTTGIGHNSLPSGHTTVGMTIAVATMMVTPPRHRPWLATVAGLYAALVGAATSTHLAHWREKRLRELMLLSGSVLAISLAMLTLVVVSRSWDDLTSPQFTGAFLTGVAAGIAATALTLTALGYALSRVDLSALSERVIDLPGTWDDPHHG